MKKDFPTMDEFAKQKKLQDDKKVATMKLKNASSVRNIR
jgi:hypothetical protein